MSETMPESLLPLCIRDTTPIGDEDGRVPYTTPERRPLNFDGLLRDLDSTEPQQVTVLVTYSRQTICVWDDYNDLMHLLWLRGVRDFRKLDYDYLTDTYERLQFCQDSQGNIGRDITLLAEQCDAGDEVPLLNTPWEDPPKESVIILIGECGMLPDGRKSYGRIVRELCDKGCTLMRVVSPFSQSELCKLEPDSTVVLYPLDDVVTRWEIPVDDNERRWCGNSGRISKQQGTLRLLQTLGLFVATSCDLLREIRVSMDLPYACEIAVWNHKQTESDTMQVGIASAFLRTYANQFGLLPSSTKLELFELAPHYYSGKHPSVFHELVLRWAVLVDRETAQLYRSLIQDAEEYFNRVARRAFDTYEAPEECFSEYCRRVLERMENMPGVFERYDFLTVLAVLFPPRGYSSIVHYQTMRALTH
jgi:hypothetical protein